MAFKGKAVLDSGSVTMFDCILDRTPDMELIDAVQRMEGIVHWHGPSQRDIAFKYENVKTEIEDALCWAQNPVSKRTLKSIAEELKAVPMKNRAAVQAWTGDVCYVVTSTMRKPGRTMEDLEPVLPFIKLMVQGLHLLPARFIRRGKFYRGERGCAPNWAEKMQPGRTIQWFAPLSFSLSPAVLKTFMATEGMRTLLELQDGVGYDIREFSIYQEPDKDDGTPVGEEEVLVESISQAEVIHVPDTHLYAQAGQCNDLKPGLHHAVLRMKPGTDLISHPASPVNAALQTTAKVAAELAMPNPTVPAKAPSMDPRACVLHRFCEPIPASPSVAAVLDLASRCAVTIGFVGTEHVLWALFNVDGYQPRIATWMAITTFGDTGAAEAQFRERVLETIQTTCSWVSAIGDKKAAEEIPLSPSMQRVMALAKQMGGGVVEDRLLNHTYKGGFMTTEFIVTAIMCDGVNLAADILSRSSQGLVNKKGLLELVNVNPDAISHHIAT